jgi:DnaK suppressor protein
MSSNMVDYGFLRDQLTSTRKALFERIEQRRSEIAVEPGPDDEGARAVDRASRDFAASRLEREMATLAEVESSLRRIADGKYGVCSVCGEAISAARLEALPWARVCVSCAAGRERSSSRQGPQWQLD